jgi:hypothetical protein
MYLSGVKLPVVTSGHVFVASYNVSVSFCTYQHNSGSQRLSFTLYIINPGTFFLAPSSFPKLYSAEQMPNP